MAPLSRRHLLGRAAALAAGAHLSLHGLARAQSAPDLPYSVLGFSQIGEPLVVHHLGAGTRRVFILGGQHGGPEVNTVRLARALMAHFAAWPEEIPEGIGLDFMPVGNPDGLTLGSRQFLSGVDPNRNWGTPDWQPDAWDSNAVFRRGLGGPEPFSEQETRALADWLRQNRPALVVNYHSAGGFMFGSGEFGRAYSEASGYWVPGGGATTTSGSGSSSAPRPSGSSVLGYRATGSMNPWLREIGVSGIFIELSTPQVMELDRNLAGLRAALAVLAETPSA